jgi:hypothetical protein
MDHQGGMKVADLLTIARIVGHPAQGGPSLIV